MRVLISREMPLEVVRLVEAKFDVARRHSDFPMTALEAQAAMAEYDAILATFGDDFSATAFDGLHDAPCKLVANFGVGINHIDVVAAQRAGIRVTNTPGVVTEATADIALTLMLMTCRRASEGERMVRAEDWHGWGPTQLLGMHMSGKTVGIIGMGRIGQAIAQRCRLGFGMPIVFFNRSEKTIEGCTQFPSIQAVMQACDIAVVALPGGADTHHMIEAQALSALRPHAVLVNIARGDVIDEAALIAALSAGQIAGAGLDVYEHEPLVPQALKDMQNVTLLPHMGTSTLEVRLDMGVMAVANLTALANGHDLPNQV
jgi:lactate dehydrogenase-like 2-hydroxyacid dehydrogenase|tara:strand:- start:217 stop:1164 length:948 start_codon:yes stop_codon:yes gene_type:complete